MSNAEAVARTLLEAVAAPASWQWEVRGSRSLRAHPRGEDE
jgi:hypothetical protein